MFGHQGFNEYTSKWIFFYFYLFRLGLTLGLDPGMLPSQDSIQGQKMQGKYIKSCTTSPILKWAFLKLKIHMLHPNAYTNLLFPLLDEWEREEHIMNVY